MIQIDSWKIEILDQIIYIFHLGWYLDKVFISQGGAGYTGYSIVDTMFDCKSALINDKGIIAFEHRINHPLKARQLKFSGFTTRPTGFPPINSIKIGLKIVR